jgi:hypothetical protein
VTPLPVTDRNSVVAAGRRHGPGAGDDRRAERVLAALLEARRDRQQRRLVAVDGRHATSG